MNKNFWISIVFILFTTTAFAKEPKWKQFIRPYVEKYLGVDFANKYLGKVKKQMQLPALPTIENDARSDKVYKKKRTVIKLDEQLEVKLNYSYVEELFSAVKEREATGGEINRWMNVMNQGASREGVYRAFILDDDYKGLENYDEEISPQGAAFALKFLENFIGLTAKKETIEQMNFYSVKRLVTEKALELIDSFEKEKQLYQWYAVLSAKLSKKYGILWENKIRKDQDPFRHFHWATQAPAQHLKSETVIKLHQVFNFLQKK